MWAREHARLEPQRSSLMQRLRTTAPVIAGSVIATFLFSWWQVRVERAQLEQEGELSQHVLEAPADVLQQVFASDDAVPAAPYYSALIAGETQEGVGAGYRFPLISRLLQPGVLPVEGAQVLNGKWMTQTIAVVGDDPGSRKWLDLHLERLHSLGTAVVVVSASEASFKALQQQVAGLPIVPDYGDWLQSRLVVAGAAVYPVFIGLDGRARQVIFNEGFATGDRQ